MGKAEEFWLWFAANEQRFRNVEGRHKESLLDEIQDHLHAFCDRLYFEVGGHPKGPHELVITAEGNRDYFAKVNELVAKGPDVAGWEFIAFKPPMGFGFVTEHRGLKLNPKEMWFLPLESKKNPRLLGLRIAGPGCEESVREQYKAACLIVLDSALGELASSEDVHYLEVGALPENPEAEGYIELAELPQYIEWRKSKL